uniref:Uncharacterized protein n=1 Tax=Ignisphaera aggregans TaxID=334771 RepID=A0A7J3JMZ4_9CREN
MHTVAILKVIALLLSMQSVFQWIVVDDYSPGRDVALSLCTYSGKIYVAGFDEVDGVPIMRVEVRNSSGALLKVWRGSVGTLYDCAVNNGIYAVGTVKISDTDFGWIILAFDWDLNVVSLNISNPSDGMDVATSVYSDSIHIYIAGIVNGSTFSGYRVEKRTADGLDLKAVHAIQVQLSWRWPYALPRIIKDQSNNLIWLLYLYVDLRDFEMPRIDIFNDNLNHIKTIDLKDIRAYPYAIAHAQNHVYIGGSMGIVKIDSNGNILKERKLGGNIIFRLAILDRDRIVAFASRIIAPHYITMNSLLVFNDDLDIVANITISTNSPWILWTGDIKIDTNSIYVAASEYATLEPRPANEAWAIYSLNRTAIEFIQERANAIQTVDVLSYVFFIITATVLIVVLRKVLTRRLHPISFIEKAFQSLKNVECR